jgi:hypothetical protein
VGAFQAKLHLLRTEHAVLNAAKLLLALVSTVILDSESYGTHDLILLSDDFGVFSVPTKRLTLKSHTYQLLQNVTGHINKILYNSRCPFLSRLEGDKVYCIHNIVFEHQVVVLEHLIYI